MYWSCAELLTQGNLSYELTNVSDLDLLRIRTQTKVFCDNEICLINTRFICLLKSFQRTFWLQRSPSPPENSSNYEITSFHLFWGNNFGLPGYGSSPDLDPKTGCYLEVFSRIKGSG